MIVPDLIQYTSIRRMREKKNTSAFLDGASFLILEVLYAWTLRDGIPPYPLNITQLH